jgi:hypothetical protein
MELKPYNTRTKVIRTARQNGHVVLAENNAVTIDTGEEVLTINEEKITNRSGKTISVDAAMDTVTAQPQD